MNTPSQQNTKELQDRFDNSGFKDIKFFVEPNSGTSAEACTEQAIKAMPLMVEVYNGKTEGVESL